MIDGKVLSLLPLAPLQTVPHSMPAPIVSHLDR